MRHTKILIFLIICTTIIVTSCNGKKQTIKAQKYHKGFRYDKNGWVYIHIEGEPYERGFQYGYLIAEEYKKAYQCYLDMSLHNLGITMDFIIKEAVKMQKNKIPDELLEEMKGIAAGISARGRLTTLDEIIGWNAYIEITQNWWPVVKSNYTSYIPTTLENKKDRCSAFIATGSYTKDKKIVMSHSTFDNFYNCKWANVILDIKPEKGHKILMQTHIAYISSMIDFFVTDSGIIAFNTTLANFKGFNEKGTPSYIRNRMAMQYANNIDEFVQIISKDNNGANSASWLIGDTKTNEIAKYELGIKFQNLQRKKDGYFIGCNFAQDPQIRNLECDFQGYDDIRKDTGAKRVRISQLIEKYKGKINIKISKKIMSDHFDIYHKKNQAAANTICAHFDEDPRYSMSSDSVSYADPFTPAGAFDCKITTSDMAKNMKFIAHFGRACDKPFKTEKFLKKHPQWNWQKGYLLDRPKQPWCEFISYKN